MEGVATAEILRGGDPPLPSRASSEIIFSQATKRDAEAGRDEAAPRRAREHDVTATILTMEPQ